MASWIGTGGSNPGDVCTNGSVGIGTTSPSYLLHAKGDSSRIVGQAVTNTTYFTVTVQNSDGDAIESVAYGRSATGTYLGQSRAGACFIGASPNAVMGIGTRNATPLVLGTSDTERMRITTDGFVGIGCTNPRVTLHVNAVLRLEPQSSAPTGGKGDMYINTNGQLFVHNGAGWKSVVYSN